MAIRYVDGEGVDKDIRQALYWWSDAAGNGHSEAQFLIGTFLEDVNRDVENAVYRYRRSAEQGNDRAKERLKRLGR